MIVSPGSLRTAASNLARKLVYGHVADLRPTPARTVGAGPRTTPVYRYRGLEGVVAAGPPVLLVPSPAAPARCFDLRRGCSLAEHAVNAGRLCYLLDHGAAEWAGEVLPEAIRTVSRDASGQPVQLVGWCLGGLFSLLAAADPDLPVASVAMIATPSRVVEPGPVRAARRVKRDYRTLANLDKTEYLAQAEALDHFHALAEAGSGRPAQEVYSALLGDDGEIGIALDAVRVPVLAVAGRADALAPVTAVRPFARLLPNAPEVRFAAVPGGHLGALTGLAARTTTWARLDRWLDEGIVRHGIRPHPRRAHARRASRRGPATAL
ncbi:alpha/beta hydrolase [Actinomadura rugatobispora]|uniref:Alpha/beta hydrolase n=1 Tax=Actinomadura rugatobispora TaxID=1994 RepID=A0ABW1A4U3_9ACTN|nr:alpha/beta hydrolase [Actinomadura rugatobispora]